MHHNVALNAQNMLCVGVTLAAAKFLGQCPYCWPDYIKEPYCIDRERVMCSLALIAMFALAIGAQMDAALSRAMLLPYISATD